jgi:hypothetical protein
VADDEKSLEMRVAAIEDKLAQMHVTEEEMQAYQKVAGLLGAQAPQPQAGCVANCIYQCINECLIRQCTIVRQCTVISQCTIIRACTYECVGPCAPGGGGIGGGGFGGFGGLGG